jgi:CubicO group peptidase (beta-lactamase class C family)
LLALAFLAAAASARAQNARDAALRDLDARLAANAAADGVGSIAAAVVIGQDVVYANAHGLMDREKKLPADARTIYRIGSISKSITAVLLMSLVQQGTVSLEDPVIKHLPEFAQLGGGVPEARTITLRQLASHTAGLIREPRLEGAAAGPIAMWEDRVIASIPATTLMGRPGAQYAYSNIGYGILGLALSRAARAPFMELVEKRIFEPAGMTSSTFIIRPPLDARLSAGYQNGRNGEIDAALPALEHAGRGYKVPNGGVYSTVHDLARFIALMSGAVGNVVLTEPSRLAMTTKQTPGDGPAYGLGFMLRTDSAGRSFVSHSGSVAGYTAFLMYEPKSRIGVVMLLNYASASTSFQAEAIRVITALLEAGNNGG